MVRFHGAQTLLAVIAVIGAATAAPANGQAAPVETGLHSIHASARVGGKLCLVDHFHEQDGQSFKTRRVAEGSAIRQWTIFTADEYGTAWGNFKAAASAKVNCKQGADKYWSCSALARPCRSGK